MPKRIESYYIHFVHREEARKKRIPHKLIKMIRIEQNLKIASIYVQYMLIFQKKVATATADKMYKFRQKKKKTEIIKSILFFSKTLQE